MNSIEKKNLGIIVAALETITISDIAFIEAGLLADTLRAGHQIKHPHCASVEMSNALSLVKLANLKSVEGAILLKHFRKNGATALKTDWSHGLPAEDIEVVA